MRLFFTFEQELGLKKRYNAELLAAGNRLNPPITFVLRLYLYFVWFFVSFWECNILWQKRFGRSEMMIAVILDEYVDSSQRKRLCFHIHFLVSNWEKFPHTNWHDTQAISKSIFVIAGDGAKYHIARRSFTLSLCFGIWWENENRPMEWLAANKKSICLQSSK